MKAFLMTPREYTPFVRLDAERGIIEIYGRTCPEDANRFYKPILKWFDEYLDSPTEDTTINLKLTFLNSTSTKKILELIKKTCLLEKKGNNVTINWHYDKGAIDMLGTGIELSSIAEVSFKYIKNN